MLGDLAILETIEQHQRDTDRFARGRNAHELALVGTAHRRVDGYLVAFGHHIVEIQLIAGKRRFEQGDVVF